MLRRRFLASCILGLFRIRASFFLSRSWPLFLPRLVDSLCSSLPLTSLGYHGVIAK